MSRRFGLILTGLFTLTPVVVSCIVAYTSRDDGEGVVILTAGLLLSILAVTIGAVLGVGLSAISSKDHEATALILYGIPNLIACFIIISLPN